MIADHALGEFAAFVVGALGFGPFGDFDFVAAFAVDAGGDLLISRARMTLCELSRLTGLGDCAGLRDCPRLSGHRWLSESCGLAWLNHLWLGRGAGLSCLGDRDASQQANRHRETDKPKAHGKLLGNPLVQGTPATNGIPICKVPTAAAETAGAQWLALTVY
jgi:hypothetical protein